MFWPEIYGDRVFPIFKLLVKLSNGVQQSAIGLFGGLCRVKLFVYSAFNDGKGAHEKEQVGFTFPISKRNVTNVVTWVFSGQLNAHIIVVLCRRSSRPEADAVGVSNGLLAMIDDVLLV